MIENEAIIDLNKKKHYFNCNIIYIIPSYKPTEQLIKLINTLDPYKHFCIIVDDGNKEEKYKIIFDELIKKNCI